MSFKHGKCSVQQTQTHTHTHTHIIILYYIIVYTYKITVHCTTLWKMFLSLRGIRGAIIRKKNMYSIIHIV